MGYYTDYSLSYEHPVDAEELASLQAKVRHFIETNEEASYALTLDGMSNESAKWYEHEEDMAELSREIPGVLFCLHCQGEDGELWCVYARDGNAEKVKAIVSYPKPTV